MKDEVPDTQYNFFDARVPRKRQRGSLSRQQLYWGQARAGINATPGPWVQHNVGAVRSQREYCEDTIRNPSYIFARPTDDGGELLLQRSYWYHEPGWFLTPWVANQRNRGMSAAAVSPTTYNGFSMVDAIAPPNSDYTDIPGYGPTGWHKAKPDNPLVDTAVFIAEARDLPRLIFQRIRDIRTISDLYLAYQFGWKPLLSDIRKLLNFGESVEQKISFLMRNNGKPVSKSVKVAHEISSEVILDGPGLNGMEVTWANAWPVGERGSKYRGCRLILERDVWFDGTFVFYIDDIKLPGTITRLRTRLAGLEITPAVVWEALPWSWLIDWFTNVGDVLANLSDTAVDRLVANRAYIMGHTKRTYKWYGTDGKTHGQSSHIYETKVRRKVSPYGLAVGGILTTRQQSILAALAASRS